ncbi:hypothetical protein CJD36_000260 [Flavipsychrobacter stenotrophus]|uniref:Uncharacterized protein n=1 Tax=Flavipsychrobacter stenotrophus TaxID=2077091 RepID=A0A2S7SZW0_9BACT|nr:hypothetical protein [Flavipsychrobacter stenotrophus]PQJ12228.1 hypothetical protein CJD36_000260 [Flavipsychrobacter stenotrophus]
MKQLHNLIITITLFVAATTHATAQDAYLYIQGDKSVPFYVKIDSVMQPRYGKNYCIVPKVHAGQVNVQILFQQNVYAPKFFTIDMPAKGHKGFLLTKQDDNFTLNDLDTKAIINPEK